MDWDVGVGLICLCFLIINYSAVLDVRDKLRRLEERVTRKGS